MKFLNRLFADTTPSNFKFRHLFDVPNVRTIPIFSLQVTIAVVAVISSIGGFLAARIFQPSTESIAEKVEKSVVLITRENRSEHGTGFFVPGSKKVCTVLTAQHVVNPESKLEIQTYDQKIWKVNNIIRLSNFDLALLTFSLPPEHENCPYKTLSFGRQQVKLGSPIFLSGFPERNGRLVKQFVSGTVTAIADPPLPQGYAISYDATTGGGMSGAPVLNSDGEVVAIHGIADIPDPARATIWQAYEENKAQFKWGIPINTYETNIPNIPTETVETTPKPETTSSSSKPNLPYFSCETVQGIPTTMIRTSQHERPFITWDSTYFAANSFTPERRCREVTARFNKYLRQSSELYITHGIMNKKPVICVTDREGGGCTGLLYELKPYQNPEMAVESLIRAAESNFESPLRL